MGASPIDEGAGVERGEADGVGQADRVVERPEGGLDVPPVDLERTAGVPDPDLLQRVARLLGEPSARSKACAAPWKSWASSAPMPIAVWAADRARASPAMHGQLERSPGRVGALLHVAPVVVGGRDPGEQQRLLGRIARR